MSSPRQSGEARPDVVAAGAVVVRKGAAGHEVLLVHRPRYDDWSFPKGKRDRGEHVAACAVREVHEETGLRVALGVPLADQRYRVAADRWKTVHYWVARAVAGTEAAFTPDDEVDEIRWLPWDEAADLLSYAYDRRTLAEARPLRRRTSAVAVLRHAKAVSRDEWHRGKPGAEDRQRPLAERGSNEALRLVEPLAAWSPQVVVTSTSTRCVQTVEPFNRAAGIAPRHVDVLSEEDADPAGVADLVAAVLAEQGRRTAVLCSHRPVLPWVFEALDVEPFALALAPASWAVVHRRAGRTVAVELHGLD